MKKISIFILIIVSGLFAQLEYSAVQESTQLELELNPLDDPVYLEINDDTDSLVWFGVVETTMTMQFEVCPTEFLELKWTAIFTNDTSQIFELSNSKVLIPGGWYRIGANQSEIDLLDALGAPPEFSARATPYRWVFVDSFSIMTTEVPCSLYSDFTDDVGGYSDNSYWSTEGWLVKESNGWTGPAVACVDGRYPVRGVSYYEAEAFAGWLGGKIPTEAQWEIAAKYGLNQIFPWGNQFCLTDFELTANISDPQQCAPDTFGGGPGYAQAFVDDLAPSGCMSMGGNVSEWCRDGWNEYSYYLDIELLNPFMDSDSQKTIRGGNYSTWNRRDCSVFYRAGFNPDSREGHLGFRVCWPMGDGDPGNWTTEILTFDCQSPDTLGMKLPDCLKQTLEDTIQIFFTEPVMGDIEIIPDDPAMVYSVWDSVPGDSLFIIKRAGALLGGDSIWVILDELTDTAGNAILYQDTVVAEICKYDIDFELDPEQLCAPIGCIVNGVLRIINLDSLGYIYIDSITVAQPFEFSVPTNQTLEPLDTFEVPIRFAPDCGGSIERQVVLYHSDGDYSENIQGVGCPTDIIRFQPSVVNFGEECDPDSEEIGIYISDCEECSLFTLEITDMWLALGEYFSTDLTIGTTLDHRSDPYMFWIFYDNDDTKGDFSDTLYLRYNPTNGEYCSDNTISLYLEANCHSTDPNDYEPRTECRGARVVKDCDTVKEGESIYFVGLYKSVSVYDKYGRLVITLDPDAEGEAAWDLVDETGQPVPAGMYYWACGSSHGNIVVVR